MCVSVPNILTFGRIGVIPMIVGLFYVDSPWAVYMRTVLFVLACLTDYLDGYVARTYHQISSLGRMLDPLADKLLVILTFFMLAGFSWIEDNLLIPTVLIIAREITIPGLREILEELEFKVLHVSRLAKWKTACQMIVIASLLFNEREPRFELLHTLNSYGLWFVAFLTLLSGYLYWRNVPTLRKTQY